MTIVKCQKCSCEVSGYDSNCPYCGTPLSATPKRVAVKVKKPVPTKAIVKYAIVAVVAILFLIALVANYKPYTGAPGNKLDEGVDKEELAKELEAWDRENLSDENYRKIHGRDK